MFQFAYDLNLLMLKNANICSVGSSPASYMNASVSVCVYVCMCVVP